MSSLPPRSGRRRGIGTPTARKLGAVRQSQLITTYGVGSMIAVDNESFVVSGLDSWDTSRTREVWEQRLTRFLGVRTFLMPPAPDPHRAVDGVRARRFPTYYSCPGCHDLQPYRKFNPPPGRAVCGVCQENLVPSRFVVACANGHLDDFPYWQWVHRAEQDRGRSACGGTLRLRTNGTTASLRSIVIGCTCGAPEVSMEGAFRRSSLARLGLSRCSGNRPWLKEAPENFCSATPRTMQRGSSAAWHPVLWSTISIPPWGEGLHKLIGPVYAQVKGHSDEKIRAFLELSRILAHRPAQTLDAAIELIRSMEAEEARVTAGDGPNGAAAYSDLRRDEYKHLRFGNPEENGEYEQDFVCEPPKGDCAVLSPFGVTGPMLVKRLREVRVLQSFTRVEPPASVRDSERFAPLSLGKDIDWLPAIEVSGEGVFLRLDEDRLRAWEQSLAVVARAERIRGNHMDLLRARAEVNDGAAPPVSPASPRFVLLHTFAHLLINEWSLDGGYPASALRERLYVSEEGGATGPEAMAGFLIYTATSDSAGSLGGVVAQGAPERLARSIRTALHRAAWCSNDPLCLESRATGTDSLNMAACHACVMLPETSCETNNNLLDRALLIGTPDGALPGFFSSMTD